MKHIILIGFMGSGKSSIGPLLAEALNLDYVDTDGFIEEEEGRSIPEIFSTFGESYFRSKESEALERILKGNACVVSTGGGIILDSRNVCLMREFGKIIYLKADVDTLYERVKNSTNRPLIQGDNAYRRFRDLFNTRQSIYENAADYVVDTSRLAMDEVVREALKVIWSEEGSC